MDLSAIWIFIKLTFTVLKQHFPKQKPRVVIHRQHKNFRNDYFKTELENALDKHVLDKHAPIKKKYLRANHANFVTKQLRKAIMKRSNYVTIFSKIKMMLPKMLIENNAIYV